MSTIISVGNSKQNFNRLLYFIPKIEHILPKPVIIQKGVSDFKSKTMIIYDFMPMKDFKRFIKDAKLVIIHAGSGTMLNAIYSNKVPVVVPRLRKFNEIIDDHQIEIAEALEKENKVVMVKNFEDFPNLITKALDIQEKIKEDKKNKNLIYKLVNDLI